jgi:hypothetical protein
MKRHVGRNADRVAGGELVPAASADLAILIAASWRAVTDELQASVVADEPRMRPSFGFVMRAVDSESPTINRLAELLGTTKQAASLLADEVEAAGFIERYTSERLEAELVSLVGEHAMLGCRETLMALVARTGALDDVLARRARPVW